MCPAEIVIPELQSTSRLQIVEPFDDVFGRRVR